MFAYSGDLRASLHPRPSSPGRALPRPVPLLRRELEVRRTEPIPWSTSSSTRHLQCKVIAIGSKDLRPKSQEGNVATEDGPPGRLEADRLGKCLAELPVSHSCSPPVSEGTVNRSLPLVITLFKALEARRLTQPKRQIALQTSQSTPRQSLAAAPSHLHSRCPAARAPTTTFVLLKVTDSPHSFSSKSQPSVPPPTCPGVPQFSLATIPPFLYWLTPSIPPFLLGFCCCFLSLSTGASWQFPPP